MLEHLPDAFGHALRNQRAGLEKIVFNQIDLRHGMAAIDVHSLAFADHAPIPASYTADGEGLSPPLNWGGVPAGAASVVLIVEDADAPTPQPLVHAIVVGLAPDQTALAQGTIDADSAETPDGSGITTGRNSMLMANWLPPDPPPGHGVHRYAFQVFALEAGAEFSATPGRDELVRALQQFALASGCLIGTYERQDGSIPASDAETGSAAPAMAQPI